MSPSHQDARPLLTPRFVIGVSILLIGITLSLDRLGLIDGDDVLRLWPLAIILIGGQIYFDSRRQAGRVNGAIWMVIGAVLLLNTLGIARVRVWELFWPAVLILIGSHLVLHAFRQGGAPPLDDSEQVNMVAILSGVKRTSSGRFRGGEITAFMGGGYLDLRQATIPPGEQATIELFAVMTGCEIYVPSNWTVSTPVAAVMGGIEDKRLPPLHGVEMAAPPSPTPPPRLVLRGLVLMGSVEIKS